MNEWAAQRSFAGRLRSRILHPPYDASIPGKIFGYLWRLVVFLGVVGLIYSQVLRSHIEGKEFRAEMAEQAAQLLHGTNAASGSIDVPLAINGTLHWNSLSMDGAPGSFFRHLEAEGISLNPGWSMFSKAWKIGRLDINALNIQLRNGGAGSSDEPEKGETPQLPATPVDRVVVPQLKVGASSSVPVTLTAGLGVNPDFSSMAINEVVCSDTDFSWGFSTTNAGVLKKAVAILEKTGSGWNLVATGGKLSQNWLNDLQNERLDVTIEPEVLRINRAAFSLAGKGHIAMGGTVKLGEIPELNLDVLMQNLPLKHITPDPFSKYFTAVGNAQGKLTGTTNRATGLQMQLHVELTGTGINDEQLRKTLPGNDPADPNGAKYGPVRALLHDLPLLRALYVAASEDRLLQPAISEGQFDLITGGGSASLRNIDFVLSDVGRIRGRIDCVEDIATAQQGIAGNQSAQLIYKTSGTLFIGLDPAIVGKMTPLVQQTYFRAEESGLRWMEVHYENEDGRELTRAKADNLTSTHLQSMGEKVR